MTNDDRDLGIAVADAIRLNGCWIDLSEQFFARPSVEGDELLWFQQASAPPGNTDWVHRVNSRNVAEVMIRRALLEHRISVWIRLPSGDALVDAHSIKEVSHKTLVTGAYRTDDREKSNLEWRPLWIKSADWQSFKCVALLSRYGEILQTEIAANETEGESHQVARGFAVADKPILDKMKRWIAEHRGGIPAAALQYVHEASGGGTDVSKAKRLERAYKKNFGRVAHSPILPSNPKKIIEN